MITIILFIGLTILTIKYQTFGIIGWILYMGWLNLALIGYSKMVFRLKKALIITGFSQEIINKIIDGTATVQKSEIVEKSEKNG